MPISKLPAMPLSCCRYQVNHLMQQGVHSGGEGGKQIPYVQLELGDTRGG